MNLSIHLKAFAGSMLPLNTPVTAFGKPGRIVGRAFTHEHYDVLFTDGAIRHSVLRSDMEMDWAHLRRAG